MVVAARIASCRMLPMLAVPGTDVGKVAYGGSHIEGGGAARMGLRDWMRRAKDGSAGGPDEVAPVGREVAASEPVRVEVQFGPDWTAGEPVKLAGTTTTTADECGHLFNFVGLPDGGHFEAAATLVAMGAEGREQPVVAVHVEGARIGFLPGYLAAQANSGNGPLVGPAADARVQMWGARVGDGLRVIGWVAQGSGPVAWTHDDDNPAAVTVEEQRAEAHTATTSMVREALDGEDPHRAEEFRRGLVGGVHYLETVEPIKQLKREGKLEEALKLCYAAIDGAEADRDGREPAPWYTEQAAIIHRKRGECDEEFAVLRRWLETCPPGRRAGSKIQERLDKLGG
jgi:hypothetical protein